MLCPLSTVSAVFTYFDVLMTWVYLVKEPKILTSKHKWKQETQEDLAKEPKILISKHKWKQETQVKTHEERERESLLTPQEA